MKINAKHVTTFAGIACGAVAGKLLVGGIKGVKNKVKQSKQKKLAMK